MVVFIAIELAQETKEGIGRYVQNKVKPICKGGRWVHSENYHLTLKYIGETPEHEIDILYQLLKDIALNHNSFMLTTGSIGTFGYPVSYAGRVRVLWLDTVGNLQALDGLRRSIEKGTVRYSFRAENRFSPHITLARDVILTKGLDDAIAPQSMDINVTAISLMESKMEKGKRVYLPLSVHKLR